MKDVKERKEIIKKLIKRLHDGESEDVIKKEFKENFDGVSSIEIADAEKLLMDEGVALEEVQSLCNVHASIFEDMVVGSSSDDRINYNEGHPISILNRENEAILELIVDTKSLLKQKNLNKEKLKEKMKLFKRIDVHYLKKENLMFPFLEKNEITGPPKVMWAVDDDIRKLIKDINNKINSNDFSTELTKLIEEMIFEVKEMVSKETNILIPMLIDTLSSSEWEIIAAEFEDIGYCLISDDFKKWQGSNKNNNQIEETVVSNDIIKFATGAMNYETLNAILNTLPIDITLVDKDDRFAYFSNGSERIFHRTIAALGRDVSNCHPAQSVHIVDKIINDFKAGIKDEEEFYLKLKDMYIYIRYFALRNENKEYLGTLEVSQNIANIQKITGEKRILG
ncbi:DUF438 domain-containing protein [Bacilli bacterium PM5-3]|nr:DUF438 domain-containing protein [Bacilli bacterium PM5-3]